jgi:hypothetical protein
MVAGLAVGVAGGVASPAYAQLRTWDQSTGFWGTVGSWSPADIPNTNAETALLPGAGAYTVTAAANYTVGGITISNPLAVLAINPSRIMTLSGVSVNDGTIVVNDAGTNADTRYTIGTTHTLDGTGDLVLNANAVNLASSYIFYTSMANTFTHGASHTIRGTGQIYPITSNAGTIVADQTGRILDLISQNKTNTGMMRATNGATLRVSSITVTNTGGQMVADNATLHLSAGGVVGGTVSSINGGATLVTGTSTMTDVTLSGTANIDPAGRLNLSGTTLTNNATITVNTAGTNVDTRLVVAAPTMSIGGTGTIVLNANPANPGSSYLFFSSTANLLTLGSGQTLRGRGDVYPNTTNNGVIDADVSGGTLRLFSQPKANNNLLRASAGGTLDIESITVTQAPGAIVRADNATVTLSSGTISGGLIESLNGGTVVVTANSGLHGVTNSAPIFASGGATLHTNAAGIVNNNVITINTTALNTDTRYTWEASTTLSGTGSIVLNANPANLGSAYLFFAASTNVLTHAAGHTIRGTGEVFVNLINNGLVLADQPGKILDLISTTKTNNSMMRAANGATLRIASITVNQNPGTGEIQADNSTVALSAATINGGTLSSPNGGTVNVSGITTLDNVVSTAQIGALPGAQLRVGANGLVNNGVITVNTAGTNIDTRLPIMATTSITGTGSIVLNADPSNLSSGYLYFASTSNVLTLGPGQTLAGTGRIFPITTMEGTISPGATPGAIGHLNFQNPVTMTPSGDLEIDIGGTATTDFDRITSTSSFQVNGFIRVNLVNGFSNPAPGTEFTIVSAPTVTGDCLLADLPAGWGVFFEPNALKVAYTGCVADVDCGSGSGTPDGGVTIDDLLYYLALFENGDLAADVDDGSGTGTQDGGVTIDDLLYYLLRFEAGC